MVLGSQLTHKIMQPVREQCKRDIGDGRRGEGE